jgi:hypothetical protein
MDMIDLLELRGIVAGNAIPAPMRDEQALERLGVAVMEGEELPPQLSPPATAGRQSADSIVADGFAKAQDALPRPDGRMIALVHGAPPSISSRLLSLRRSSRVSGYCLRM